MEKQLTFLHEEPKREQEYHNKGDFITYIGERIGAFCNFFKIYFVALGL